MAEQLARTRRAYATTGRARDAAAKQRGNRGHDDEVADQRRRAGRVQPGLRSHQPQGLGDSAGLIHSSSGRAPGRGRAADRADRRRPFQGAAASRRTARARRTTCRRPAGRHHCLPSLRHQRVEAITFTIEVIRRRFPRPQQSRTGTPVNPLVHNSGRCPTTRSASISSRPRCSSCAVRPASGQSRPTPESSRSSSQSTSSVPLCLSRCPYRCTT